MQFKTLRGQKAEGPTRKEEEEEQCRHAEKHAPLEHARS